MLLTAALAAAQQGDANAFTEFSPSPSPEPSPSPSPEPSPEFVRVGYYVNNEYADPDLAAAPPERPVVEKLQRSIMADYPRHARACCCVFSCVCVCVCCVCVPLC